MKRSYISVYQKKQKHHQKTPRHSDHSEAPKRQQIIKKKPVLPLCDHEKHYHEHQSTPSEPLSSPNDELVMNERQRRIELAKAKILEKRSTFQLCKVGAEKSKNFQVVVRVRPPLPRETRNINNIKVVEVDKTNHLLTLCERYPVLNENHDTITNIERGRDYSFKFDYVHNENSSQEEVYQISAKNAIFSVLQGYNSSLIAYGQTASGKTHTMEGFSLDSQRGIIPRAVEDIFDYIKYSGDRKKKWLVRASFLQIYNEAISDLLKTPTADAPAKNLLIREDKLRGVYVVGLSEWLVKCPQDVYTLMERGDKIRKTAATRVNELSSRSHALFQIITEQCTTELDENNYETSDIKIGKLNIVDLAGSERVRFTGATGQQLEESKNINQSLSALGNVISLLTDTKKTLSKHHIPYRDSKLTRILQDSLGGNCKTILLAMLSPVLESFQETMSTLHFATRAKHVTNKARVNADLDEKGLIRRYEAELQRLRKELEKKSQFLVDKRRLLQLEAEKRKAEEDKIQALLALERRSQEVLLVKKAKERLEGQIELMQSQLLGGTVLGGGEGDHLVKTAIQKERHRWKTEYEARLMELEKEKRNLQQGHSKIEKYKTLLLKQRDVMIALTNRLSNKEQEVIDLNEQLREQKQLRLTIEDSLDRSNAKLFHFQRLLAEAMEQGDLDHDHKLHYIRHLMREYDGRSGRETPKKSPLEPKIPLEIDILEKEIFQLDATSETDDDDDEQEKKPILGDLLLEAPRKLLPVPYNDESTNILVQKKYLENQNTLSLKMRALLSRIKESGAGDTVKDRHSFENYCNMLFQLVEESQSLTKMNL